MTMAVIRYLAFGYTFSVTVSYLPHCLQFMQYFSQTMLGPLPHQNCSNWIMFSVKPPFYSPVALPLASQF